MYYVVPQDMLWQNSFGRYLNFKQTNKETKNKTGLTIDYPTVLV